MDFYAIIMAGGIGSRFWPLSRKAKSKQFLPIISEKTMIEETIQRLRPLFPARNITTVADARQTQTIAGLFPEIPEENFLIEPRGKNTAPSLLLATAKIALRDPEAVCAALPADHLITDVPLFLKKLEAGAEAAVREDSLVTFGIPPTYPSTGYGYIRFSRETGRKVEEENFFAVQEFKEKPGCEQAKTFLEAGNYAWNSGMFLWKVQTFARKLEQFAPDWFVYWQKMLHALEDNDNARIAALFDAIPATSIDYALMEKAQGVLMCEGNFGWSDVGAWSALAAIWEKDPDRNALRGKALVLDSEDCLVFNPKKLTALVGVKDLIVVDTDDALLICRKDQDQRVKDIVARLKKEGMDDFL
ncbi:MAG: mannose-1-phosphate guanylyltransferase [Candidatus Aminicenantes bacterium]|nr:mannose-1-phosphate guanylyltransferase [Candidatus Aminicenantes bacterium]